MAGEQRIIKIVKTNCIQLSKEQPPGGRHIIIQAQREDYMREMTRNYPKDKKSQSSSSTDRPDRNLDQIGLQKYLVQFYLYEIYEEMSMSKAWNGS